MIGILVVAKVKATVLYWLEKEEVEVEEKAVLKLKKKLRRKRIEVEAEIKMLLESKDPEEGDLEASQYLCAQIQMTKLFIKQESLVVKIFEYILEVLMS